MYTAFLLFFLTGVIAPFFFLRLADAKRKAQENSSVGTMYAWLLVIALFFGVTAPVQLITPFDFIPTGIIASVAVGYWIHTLWWKTIPYAEKPETKEEARQRDWKEYWTKREEVHSLKPSKEEALAYIASEVTRIGHPTAKAAVEQFSLFLQHEGLDRLPDEYPSDLDKALHELSVYRSKRESHYMDVAKQMVDEYRQFATRNPLPNTGEFVSSEGASTDALVDAAANLVRSLPIKQIEHLYNFFDTLPPSQQKVEKDKTFREMGEWFLRDIVSYTDVPKDARFEHGWILGPQGSGKTQLMQHLILKDIKDGTSVFVMDSQGDLVKNVSTLASIQDRLLLIEPDTVSVNPFDLRGDAAVDLLTYVFGALGEGATFTPKQTTLYQYCIRLLQEIPNANLITFLSILEGNIEPYTNELARQSQTVQSFFRNDLMSKSFGDTRGEVGWRLKLLLSDPTFERMFTTPTNFDLGSAIDKGMVVVVDTNKQKLGNQRSSIFGRFMIAYLLYSAQQRASQSRSARSPVHAYIDEAHEYLQDDTVATILDQARKMRIGMMLANQRTQQIGNPNMLDALMTTSVKFVHTDNDRDTHMLARTMKTTPDWIAKLPKQTFGLFVRGWEEPFPAVIPFLEMEQAEHVTEPRRTLKRKETVLPLQNVTSQAAADPSVASDTL